MLKSIPKTNSALEIRNLNLRIFQEPILHNINMEIQANTITGLIGGSGSGKSTLFKTILQIQLPHYANISGEFFFFGDKLNGKNRKFIQPVFQDPIGYFNPRWSLRKILYEPLEINFILTEKEKDTRVVSLIEEFGFKPDALDKSIREFSGGEMQRFAILRAILAEPKIILMDEPVSALDPLVQKDVVLFIKNIQKSKKLTILFISHDIEIVGWLCEKVYVMRNGQIVEFGKSDRIFKSPAHEYTKTLIDSAYSTY